MDKSAYEQLLAQPGVEKVRTYFSLDTNNMLSIVVVGVDAQGEDMTSGVIIMTIQNEENQEIRSYFTLNLGIMNYQMN